LAPPNTNRRISAASSKASPENFLYAFGGSVDGFRRARRKSR
jgi:hypothetical protein